MPELWIDPDVRPANFRRKRRKNSVHRRLDRRARSW
jgi:hypothetical protein